MKDKSFVIRYKWWIIIGTINTIIFSIVYNHFSFSFPFDWRSYLFFLLGSLIGGIFNDYRNDELVIFPEIWISIYEGVVFSIFYGIIIQILINKIIIYPQSIYPVQLFISLPAFIMITIFIPINILCGFIGRIYKEYKDCKTIVKK